MCTSNNHIFWLNTGRCSWYLMTFYIFVFCFFLVQPCTFSLFQQFVDLMLYLATTIWNKLIGYKRGMKAFQTCDLFLVSKRSRHTHLKEHNIQNAQFVLTFLLTALSLAFWYHCQPGRAIKLLNRCKHQENTCSCLTWLSLYKVTELDLPLCRTGAFHSVMKTKLTGNSSANEKTKELITSYLKCHPDWFKNTPSISPFLSAIMKSLAQLSDRKAFLPSNMRNSTSLPLTADCV